MIIRINGSISYTGVYKVTYPPPHLAVGKNINCGRGKRHFGEENKGLKHGGGEEYKVIGNYYTPDHNIIHTITKYHSTQLTSDPRTTGGGLNN